MVFTGVANTTSTPTGCMGGRGRAGSLEVEGKGYVFPKLANSIHWCHFTSKYHTKQLNPLPNSSANRVVNHSRLSTCQGKMARGHLKATRALVDAKQTRERGLSESRLFNLQQY